MTTPRGNSTGANRGNGGGNLCFLRSLLFISLAAPFVMALPLLGETAPIVSPVVAYQFHDGAPAMSPIVGYQFFESGGTSTNTPLVSPVVGYQFFEWPDGLSRAAVTSAQVSYFQQIATEPGVVTLHGRVTDPGGAPLAGATVSATVGSTPVAQATTDSSGGYNFPALGAGIYVLSASLAGHQSSARALTLSGATAEQDFQLAALPLPPQVQQTSRQAPAFAFPPVGLLGEQLEIFDGAGFVQIDPTRAPSPDLMTIVMTHGWNSDPTVWATKMASTIASDMAAKGVSANILAWDWRYAAESPKAVLVPLVEEYTPAEGVLLGQSLQTVLGPDYSQPLHFIGHSLGTLVNAAAINYLHGDRTAEQTVSATPWRSAPILATLLDEAEAAFAPSGALEWVFDGLTVTFADAGVPLASPPAGGLLGYKSPIPVQVDWVDNYVSEFGYYHPEAVNVALQKGPSSLDVTGRHAYACDWYEMTVGNPSGCLLGFQRSYEYALASGQPHAFPPPTSVLSPGDAYHQDPASSDELALVQLPPEEVFQVTAPILGHFPDAIVQGAVGAVQAAGQVVAQVEATAGAAADWASSGFNYVGNLASQGEQGLVNLWDSAALQLTLQTTPQPQPHRMDAGGRQAMAWVPLAFPSDATAMAFDFEVTGDSAQDVVVCGIGTNNLFSIQAQYVPTNTVSSSRLIDVTPWSGTTNELFLGLMGGTSTNCTLQVDNIRFYSLQQPRLEAQSVGTNVVLSWPATAAGYMVESVPSLTSTNWEFLTDPPAISGASYVITNAPSSESMFYRLGER